MDEDPICILFKAFSCSLKFTDSSELCCGLTDQVQTSQTLKTVQE